ncbi:uncharacterized protein L969DRAFT_91075 [Mixia osmundae IAM 14324]|uniref:uncharacterized protein n=1 Tax=Mixia osmundae (strain CBS 9802 / IAM 14324 / JCM 22182 / KY 12970) TaxID=764103 RepID=UPI0004A546B4|nr:uncharacterized protein L969DRAFT_91075 [Mixia osmundae IAM 14324]KEI36237.1 hypothetical protein L969DRAFT_91075 [Mixia osmundae IAM 14324]
MANSQRQILAAAASNIASSSSTVKQRRASSLLEAKGVSRDMLDTWRRMLLKDLMPDLPLTRMGYSIGHHVMKRIQARIAPASRWDQCHIRYDLADLALYKLRESTKAGERYVVLDEQLDDLPAWLLEASHSANNNFRCLRNDCTQLVPAECGSRLCESHCTSADRSASAFEIEHICMAHQQ